MNDLDITKLLESTLTFLEQLFLTLSNNIVVGFFIVVIMVLTVLALISLMRVRWFYQREQTQLNRLEMFLDKLDKLEEGQQRAKAVNEAKNHLLLAFEKSSYLVYERIRFVLKLAESGKLGRIQAIAETMPPRKLARQQSYFAHFVISVLLIIGLAGTLWAFEDILASSGFNSAIQGGEIQLEKYTPVIGNIYEGLKSAMLASLAGIIGTIILLFVKFNGVQPVQERFFSHLDWITEFYLIPLCSQVEHDQIDQSLFHTTEKLAQVVSGIENISHDMRSNVKHSNSLAQELNTFSDNLARKLNDFTEKTGDVVKLFGEATNKQSPFYQASTRLSDSVEITKGSYELLTNRIDNLVTEHNKSISRYEIYISQLQETQEGFTHSQQQLITKIDEIPGGFQNFIDDYGKTLGQTKSFIKILEDLVKHFENQQIDYTAHVRYAADSMITSLKGVNETTAELEGFTNAFNKQVQSLIPELTKLGVDPLLHQYVEELKNSLIHTQSEFMASIQQQQKAVQKEFNQMDSLKKIENSVEEMRDLLKERQKSWFSSFFKRN
ncbi:hypothetical protein [Candidatus Parabeggiatoa sp. HSG14]|uniref:hypothetical protein n=1 Tax=Candidatus Parabeggiatoa sp. HSG14 TaxID=3055593 RepID=UPI0025A6BD60|nr:hypothetical protein [Thiotrichales bacterium HSG14]